MKKRILSVIIIGIVGITGLVGCGNKELTTEEKKEVIQQLQKEIKEENSIKVKETLSEEEFNNFKNAFDLWSDYESQNVITMDSVYTTDNNKTIEESNRLIDNAIKASPKSVKNDIESIKDINNELMEFLSKEYKIDSKDMADKYCEIYGRLLEKTEKVWNYLNTESNK